jgi:hypothetical protein
VAFGFADFITASTMLVRGDPLAPSKNTTFQWLSRPQCLRATLVASSIYWRGDAVFGAFPRA